MVEREDAFTPTSEREDAFTPTAQRDDILTLVLAMQRRRRMSELVGTLAVWGNHS